MKISKNRNPYKRNSKQQQWFQKREEHLTDKENVLANEKEPGQLHDILPDTIHEVNHIYKLLDGNKKRLRDTFDSLHINNDTFAELDNIIKTYEGLVDLLSIRLESHRMLMNPSLKESDLPIPINIYKKVEKIYKCLHERRVKKKINIVLSGSSKNTINLRNNIEIALFIVIENAIKYSPFGEEIKISFEESPNCLIVKFVNWAQCPPDEEMEYLTKRGYRSTVVKGLNGITGSGLGLYLFKQICDSNNVRFKIEKDKEKKAIAGIFYNHFIVTLEFFC